MIRVVLVKKMSVRLARKDTSKSNELSSFPITFELGA